jgi:agmatine deiminase
MELLGVTQVVWLGDGLIEDRDTDGHVDLIAAFTSPGEVLLCTPADGPDAEPMAENERRLREAGLAVTRFEPLTHVEVAGERAVASYLNFYLCNGALILPLFGGETDDGATEAITAAYPDRAIVGVPAATIAYGGGGPHCITQQVPAVRSPAW